jgi:hypothetical protein
MTKIYSLVAVAIATLCAVPAEAAPRVAGCVNPQDLMVAASVDPNNEAIDAAPFIRTAITNALAGSHVVCLPGRTYKLLSAVGSTIFDLTNATDLAIIGEGPGTVLELGGAGGADVQVFNLASGASRVRFQDFAVTGENNTTGGATSSLFKIGGGAAAVADIALEGVQVLQAKGAGVVIDGVAAPTAGVEIRACRFFANQGSAVQVQGASRVVITASYFANDLGLEIEAPSARAIAGLTVSNNVFTRLQPFPSGPVPGAAPALAIQLSAPTATPSSQLAIVDNLVLGGRISITRFQQVTIAGNTVFGDVQATADPELLVTGGAGSIEVTSNVFERSSCTAGAVVRIGVAADALQHVGFVGNAVAQTTASCPAAGIASPLQVAGASNAVVGGNTISLAASAPVAGVLIGPSSTAAAYVSVASNSIAGAAVGSLASGIELGASAGASPFAIVTDNVTARATIGVKVDATSAAVIPLILNNVFADATTAISTTASNPAVAIRSNLRGPSHFTGTGSPQGVIAAPIGSLYFQTNATANGLWVKETGTGNTGWVAKN